MAVDTTDICLLSPSDITGTYTSQVTVKALGALVRICVIDYFTEVPTLFNCYLLCFIVT